MTFNETKELILLKHVIKRKGLRRGEGSPHKLKNPWKNIGGTP